MSGYFDQSVRSIESRCVVIYHAPLHDSPSNLRSRFCFRHLAIAAVLYLRYLFNSSPPGQKGRHFADNIFRCSFVNEKFGILIKISLKFVPKSPIDNDPELV